jgi:hypothetical protein
MILATHALAGAAIGSKINNPYLVVATSLVIHFVMDSFRHGEYFDSRVATIKSAYWKVALDFFTGIFIIAIYVYTQDASGQKLFNIALGTFFSMFPDSLTLLYWKFKFPLLEKIKIFHSWSHHYGKFPKFSPERQWTLRNAANDIIFSLIAIIILFIK